MAATTTTPFHSRRPETFSAMTIAGGLANDTINLISSSTLLSSSVYGGGATGGSPTPKTASVWVLSHPVSFSPTLVLTPSTSLALQPLPPYVVVKVAISSPLLLPSVSPTSTAILVVTRSLLVQQLQVILLSGAAASRTLPMISRQLDLRQHCC